MNLQELPKTAATTALKLAGKAREAVEKQFGGGNGADASTPDRAQEPAVEPTKAKAAKPKATPKKPAAKKPAAKKPAAKKPAAKKAAPKKPTAASAASSPTPTSTASAAERAEVIGEQTDGLDDAVDRAQFELHKRDVNGSQ